MAANNLRIIYNNLVDSISSSNISVSSTASGSTTAANLQKDSKSDVWRSGTRTSGGAQANIVVNLGTANIVGGVVIPFCNLTSTATIRVRGFTGALPTLGGTVDSPTVATTGTLVFDTGAVSTCPYQPLGLWDWGTQALGVNSYSYGGGTYARVWFEQKAVTSLLIEIVDTSNTSNYVEASRLIVGSYWSPKFNTSYGMSTSVKDLSEHSRTESGNLVTNRGIKYSTLTFDLNWLTSADRVIFNQITKGNGLPKPLFISLFPDNSSDWAKEQAHQIYGKLSQLGGISHPVYEMYSTQVEIEEI